MNSLSKRMTILKSWLTLNLLCFSLYSEIIHGLSIMTSSSSSSPLLSSPLNRGAGSQSVFLSKVKESYVSTKASESIYDESAAFQENNITGEENRKNNSTNIESTASIQSSSSLEGEDHNYNVVAAPKKKFYKSSKIRQSKFSISTSHDSSPTRKSNVEKNSTIKSCLKLLIHMMRPGNFPGVILFHLIGIHRSLSLLFQHKKGYTIHLFIQTAIQPTMIATLFTLLLIVSTSMIVNDYYDARSGVDYLKLIKNKRSPFEQHYHDYSKKDNSSKAIADDTLLKPLASGEVPLHVAKRFLSFLYGILLVTICSLPGSVTRLLSIGGSIMTFYYTKHIKPKTWMKNFSCAVLMSMAPLTSGYATLCHPFVKNMFIENDINFFTIWKGLYPLVFSLFCGFMGREIVMDCSDYDADKNTGIQTVPVVYGKKIACRAVLLVWFASGLFMTTGPILDLFSILIKEPFSYRRIPTRYITKLIFAIIGSASIAFRGIQLVSTEGNNEKLLQDAIEGTKMSMIFLLASSI